MKENPTWSSQLTQKKPFKNLLLFHDEKKIRKIEKEGNFLNITKGIFEEPMANIKFNGKRANALPPTIRNRKRILAFTTVVKHCTQSSSQSN